MPIAERPQRTCIGCRVSCAQDDLLRLQLVGEQGQVTPSVSRRGRAGRGAYLCPRRSCLDQAIKRRAFTRAFSTRSCSRSVAAIDPEQLWTAALEQVRREIDLTSSNASPHRRALERLSFELSCPPIPTVRPDRHARSNGQGGSPAHG